MAAVAYYRIYRDGVLIASPTASPYTDTGLTNGRTYSYQISAVDTNGVEGLKSAPVFATPFGPAASTSRAFGQVRLVITSPKKIASGQSRSVIVSPVQTIHGQARVVMDAPIKRASGQARAKTITAVVSSDRYGPGLSSDNLSGLAIGGSSTESLAIRFKAEFTGRINAIRPFFATGGGTGGQIGIALASTLTGGALASHTHSPGTVSSDAERYPRVVLDTTGAVVAGQTYYFRFTNTNATPTTNYVSLNSLWQKVWFNPRTMRFTDADWGLLRNLNNGAGWVDVSGYIPILDIEYDDGNHQGQGYIWGSGTGRKAVGGANSVREHLTVTGSHSITGLTITARRISGTGALTATFNTGQFATFPSGSFPIASASTDEGDARVSANLNQQVTLTGSAELTFTAPAGTEYRIGALQRGSDSHSFGTNTVFTDGTAQVSTNSGSSWGAWGGLNGATSTEGNIPWSSGVIISTPFGTLQAAVNAASAGGTINAPSNSVFNEFVTIPSSKTGLIINLNGSQINGQNTRKQWMSISANNVTIRGGAMLNAASASLPGEFQLGSLVGNSVSNLTLDGLHLSGGAADNFAMQGICSGLTIKNCEIDNARVEGITFGLVSNVLIDNNHIHHNNILGLGDPANEAGGIKCGNNATGITITNNEVDHNIGPGIWIDVLGQGVNIQNNRVHHNDGPGIMFEVSGYNGDTGALGAASFIQDNKVWENGWHGVFDWTQGGILVSSAANVTVRRNVSAWNRHAMVIYEQHRLIPPGNTTNFDVRSVNVNNNTFVLGTRTLEVNEFPAMQWWGRDDTGTIFTDPGNVGSANAHWSAYADGDYGTFQWNGAGIYTIAQWNATPVGGGNSTRITSGARDTILIAANIPTTPEAHGNFTTIQDAVNAASAGSTVSVPAGTYRELVTINKALTLVGEPGAIIDGRNSGGTPVRSGWVSVSHDDVTVRGFTMQYTTGDYSTQYSAAGVNVSSGINRFVLDQCNLSYSWVNVSIIGAIDSTISNCNIHDAKHLGVRAGAFPGPTKGLRQTINGNTIYHNNRIGDSDPDLDGGNLKATNSNQIIIEGNEVYDSDNGLWLDVTCLNSIIRNNKVHNHDTAGIFDETSTGTKIYSNACWANGFGTFGTFWWGAGILIASSKDSEIYNNTLGWNRNGISVSSQNRGDNAGSTGHYVHDNTIVATLPTGSEQYVGLWFVQDWAGQLYAPASNNTGLNNKFWYPDTTTLPNRFYWNGNLNITNFAATAGGTGSTYISAGAKTTALAAAGIPATP